MSLKEDFKYFEERLADYLKDHRGQFVLIKDKAEHGFYPTREEALKAGIGKFGVADYLIQEVTDVIPTNYINSSFVA